MLTYERIKELIDQLIVLREGAGDGLASKAPLLYPTLKRSGRLIKAGERFNHNKRIIRAAADLWDTAENSPESAPNLWEEIEYVGGVRVIPKVITSGKAFALHEIGFWQGKRYKSLISANVFTPAAYPAGWEEVE